MRTLNVLGLMLVLASCTGEEPKGTLSELESDLVASPGAAVAVPGDYDGDGLTDFALKGANGIWYIDMAACDPVGSVPTNPTRCTLGANGYGGRWDFAFPGYGDDTAIPVPADYGRSDGDKDYCVGNSGPLCPRTDIAVKDATGAWMIDYADNGFGKWDKILTGYGCCSTPVPADYDGDGRADLAVRESTGRWYIDLAADGFGSWNTPSGILHTSLSSASAVPVPAC